MARKERINAEPAHPVVTGGLELLTAVLIAVPSTRVAGLVLGAAV